jgi:hypothetical protein
VTKLWIGSGSVPAWTSSSPSTRTPVPRSNTIKLSSSVRTPTQTVLPPYLTVDGPGVAIEPRTP